MAIQINVTLNKGGLVIPEGSLLKPIYTFPADILGVNPDGTWDGTKQRLVSWNLPVFASITSFQKLESAIGPVDSFPFGNTKVMTDKEFEELSGPNAFITVESWVQTWLETYIGAESTSLVDPYK